MKKEESVPIKEERNENVWDSNDWTENEYILTDLDRPLSIESNLNEISIESRFSKDNSMKIEIEARDMGITIEFENDLFDPILFAKERLGFKSGEYDSNNNKYHYTESIMDRDFGIYNEVAVKCLAIMGNGIRTGIEILLNLKSNNEICLKVDHYNKKDEWIGAIYVESFECSVYGLLTFIQNKFNVKELIPPPLK